jgi:hypothetical protein
MMSLMSFKRNPHLFKSCTVSHVVTSSRLRIVLGATGSVLAPVAGSLTASFSSPFPFHFLAAILASRNFFSVRTPCWGFFPRPRSASCSLHQNTERPEMTDRRRRPEMTDRR